MPKSAVKLDIKIESRILEQKIKKFANTHQVASWKVISKMVEWFTQSVVKVTPHTKKKERPVFKLDNPWYSGKDQEIKKYGIPMRGKKSLTKYTKLKKEAKRYRKITYRSIGKYGWAAAGKSFLKTPISTKIDFSTEVKRMGSKIQKVSKKRYRLKPFVLLTNKVKGIARYGDYATAQALRKAKNRLIGFNRELKKGYAKMWD